MNSLLLLVIGSAIAVVFYFLGHFLTLPHDPKEPPLIAPRIPLIGHVIGLLYNGTGYYSKVALVLQTASVATISSLTNLGLC